MMTCNTFIPDALLTSLEQVGPLYTPSDLEAAQAIVGRINAGENVPATDLRMAAATSAYYGDLENAIALIGIAKRAKP